jgi:hypothetical protein
MKEHAAGMSMRRHMITGMGIMLMGMAAVVMSMAVRGMSIIIMGVRLGGRFRCCFCRDRLLGRPC